jgi:hypothetical protein
MTWNELLVRGFSAQQLLLKITAIATILRNINLRCNTSLRSLTFICNPQSTSGRPMEWVLSLLSQVSSPYMEEVDFWVNFAPCKEQVDWAKMDRLFAKPEFAGLRVIRLCLHHLPAHGRLQGQAETAFIRDMLPGCEARGVLHITKAT